MINNPKWIFLLFGNCILIFLIQLINDALGKFTINLYPYALFVFVPIILVPYSTGLISVFITGLILDASAMLPFGTTTILFSIVYTGCFWVHKRFKAYSDWYNMILLQFANAILFSLLSVLINSSNYGSSHFWISILMNLFFSQIVLLFITPWFLGLQYSMLNFLAYKINSKINSTSNSSKSNFIKVHEKTD